MKYAKFHLDGLWPLNKQRNGFTERRLAKLLAAWSKLPHVRRIVMQNDMPVLRFDSI